MNNKTKIFIRKAEYGDREVIFSIVNEAYQVETGNTGVAFKCADRFTGIEKVDQELESMVVAVLEGEVVGVLGSEKLGDEVLVGPIAVKTGMQGKGIGSRLFKFAEENFKNITIGVVSCRSDLFPMYENWGYRFAREVPLEEVVNPAALTRQGLKFIYLKKI